MAALLGSVGTVFAEGDSDGDIRITLYNKTLERIASTAEVGETGEALYDTQEGVHDTVADTTGAEVDHFYIWTCIGDECVAVDPVRFSN